MTDDLDAIIDGRITLDGLIDRCVWSNLPGELQDKWRVFEAMRRDPVNQLAHATWELFALVLMDGCAHTRYIYRQLFVDPGSLVREHCRSVYCAWCGSHSNTAVDVQVIYSAPLRSPTT